MEWGLGIEKEFPVLIGPYTYAFLQHTTRNIKEVFDKHFSGLFDVRNEIGTYLLSISQSLIPKESYFTIDGARHVDDFHKFHLLPHMLKSDVRINFGEFYYNFTGQNFSLLSLYNEDFVHWISEKIRVEDSSKNIDVVYFGKFYRCFTEFVLEINGGDDLLYLCLYHSLISRVKFDTGMLFKRLFLFEVPERTASIFDEKYTVKQAYVFKWMDDCYNVLRVKNHQAFLDRTQYHISRSKYYGSVIESKKELAPFINWDITTFVWYEENAEYNLKSMRGMVSDKFVLESDSGGTEVRTFEDGPHETFLNKTVKECVSYLSNKEKQVYVKIKSLLSANEKEQHVDVVLETMMASYFKPIFLNLSTTRHPFGQSLPNIVSYNFTFVQEYTGENEINLTLPYVQFHTLTKEQSKQYFIQKSSNSQAPDKSPSEICKILKTYGNEKCDNSMFIIDPGDPDDVISIKRNLIDMFNDYALLFEQKHIDLMKVLQLLSPLFVASFTGVQYLSFGDDFTIPETSKRFQLLGYRFLTEQNIDTIYDNDDGFNYYDIKMNKEIQTLLEKKGINPEPNSFEFSVNRKHTIKHDPCQNKFFGFEWKVLDQYPTNTIPHILLLVIMIAQHIENLDKRAPLIKGSVPELVKSRCVDFVSWIDEVIFQGWNSSLDSGYTNLVSEILQIQMHDLNTDTCFEFLQSLHEYWYDQFSNENADDLKILMCFFPDFHTNTRELRKLPNINKDNYSMMMDDFLLHFPESFGKIVDNLTETHEDYVDYMSWKRNKHHQTTHT